MKFQLTVLIILISILTVFSFWPSFLEAHYDGIISCPIMMGDMSGCQNMTAHMNNILSHISDFLGMIAVILNVGFWQALIIGLIGACFVVLLLKHRIFVEKKLQNVFLKITQFLCLFIRLENIIFQGLRIGILNTKVF